MPFANIDLWLENLKGQSESIFKMSIVKVRDDKRINLILEIVAFFGNHNIEYMLGGGTACELIKEKKVFKPKDKEHDVDFHVWEKHKDLLNGLIDELKNSGYEIISKTDYKTQVKKYDILVEIIFLFEENGNVCFRTTDPSNNGKRCCPRDSFRKQSITIAEKTIDVVSQRYCDCLYS